MKKGSVLILSFMVILLANWAAPPTKDGAQFYGTLITQQGNTSKVNNISFGDGKKTKQIPMYEKPKKKGKFQKSSDKITLKVDPQKELAITFTDLNEITELRVPKPNEKWTYKKEKSYREKEYIEVIVTSKNLRKTKTNYLLERDMELHCSGINDAGPEEKEVPLAAIDRLIIDGYYYKKEGEIPPYIQEQKAPIKHATNKVAVQTQQLNPLP